MQGLGNTTDLGRNGFNGCPQGWILATVSNTMRTARSRTSGENLFDFFMAPFSQMLEPPQKPGRFMAAASAKVIKRQSLNKVIVDSNVQEKAIAYP